MKCTLVVLGCITLAALGGPGRVSAQIAGMPVWNSPKGGTGLTLAVDYGSPDSAGGKGSVYAGRVVLGLQVLTLSATIGVRDPGGTASNSTQYGGTAALRLIGGSLMPVAVNLQGGFASFSVSSVQNTRATGAVGFAIDIPTPVVTVEPWIAPGIRMNHTDANGVIPSETNTTFGIAGGLTMRFGMLGIHMALDYEDIAGGGHTSTFGIGAHLALRSSFGL